MIALKRLVYDAELGYLLLDKGQSVYSVKQRLAAAPVKAEPKKKGVDAKTGALLVVLASVAGVFIGLLLNVLGVI